MSRSLAAWYHKQINANMLQADKQQWQCIQQLDYLLTAANQQLPAVINISRVSNLREVLSFAMQMMASCSKRIIYKLLHWKQQYLHCMGCYVYGSVGSGKSVILRQLYLQLNSNRKLMIHFHEFMQQIQHDLALLQCKNPLAVIAQTFKQHYDVIYLDELHIMDIGTASTIFGLMQACFAKHIWLIISSNYAPTELCTNPLWQARFATIVSLLHTKLQVIPLSTKDYRYNSQFNNQLLMLYDTQQDYSIWQEATQHRLERLFYHYSNSSAKTNTAATTSAEQSSSMSGIINICQRRIAYIKASTIVIWFEFDVICGSPRAVADYLDLSKQYQVMIICHAHADSSNNLMRFVQLIDVWYEQKLILVLQSLVPITQLVANSPRTLSRLYEMQSIDYSKSNSIDAIR